MIRALYTAASGLLVGLRRQEVISNNLANAETPGYKGEMGVTTAFSGVLANRIGPAPVPVPLTSQAVIGPVGTGAYQSLRRPNFAEGTQKTTGAPLDVAIQGPGFFAVQRGTDVQYTRDGHFGRNAQNELIASDGSQVLDANGQPIAIATDQVSIRPTGEILADGVSIGFIQVVQLDRTSVTRAGETRFAPGAAPVEVMTLGTGTVLQQGNLEQANVDITDTATRLMSEQRSFEASQHVFTTVDETLAQAVRDLSRMTPA